MEESVPTVRLRPIFVAMALATFFLFLVCPTALAVSALVLAPPDVAIVIAPAALAFAGGLGYLMSSSYHWIELRGGIIRGRRMLSRRMFVADVGDLDDIQPLNSNALGPVENRLLDYAMNTSNRGYQLRFRGGSKIGLIRGDMAGLDEFLAALLLQFKESDASMGDAGE